MPAYRVRMTKLPRAVVGLLPLAAVLTACAAQPGTPAPSDPVPSLTVSPPSPSSELPASEAELTEWAAVALPEDRPGGAGWVAQGADPVGPAGGMIDAVPEAGRFEIVLACQSVDGSPLSLRVTGAAAADPLEIPCSEPGGSPAGSEAVVYESTPETRLEVSATADAVYAYAIRPYSEPGS
jgi:hypothetical protein